MAAEPEWTLALRGERIAVAGGVYGLRARYRSAPVVDLGEATVVPGFNDAHNIRRSAPSSRYSSTPTLGSSGRPDETLAALADRAAAAPRGDRIVASGFDLTLRGGRRTVASAVGERSRGIEQLAARVAPTTSWGIRDGAEASRP